ncbi:MAG: hypothetical protein K2O18_05980, partial [Oscillospiraceae bacterium]|nr:hypothetical protein [Oscillospiraceae bacterium]
MAENIDPNNMTPEQYDEFLEKLVELGILSQEAIERVGYHGMFAEYGREIPITCTGPQNFTPAFQLSPVDNDIEGWIQNRLLWKPGITRESAKRDGFVPQYDRITEDEKTLSIISEILADVKRQRAGISL